MADDRAGRHAPLGPDRLALDAIARVGDRVLVRTLGDPDTLHADREAGQVHHDEHVLEAAVLLADEVTDRAALVAIGEHRRRARVDAELVLDRHAVDVVARAQRAVVVDQELGHDEQRYALDAFGRVGGARQHQVDDVLGVVVLAEGDEDLLAEDLVRPVALRQRLAAHRGEVGAGLRLGQVHRPGPRPGDHVRQEPGLQCIRAAELQRLDRALREQRAEVEREIRRMPHLLDRGGENLRQALAAVVGVLGEAVPAVVAELPVGFLEAGGRGHRAVVVPARTFLVAGLVDRVKHVGRELARFFEDRRDDVGRRLLESRQPADGLDAGELVEDEPHVRQGCVIGAHRWTSSNRKGRRSSVAPAARANALIDAAQRAAPVARRRSRATARRARTAGAAAARAVSRARQSAPEPPRTGRRRGRSRRPGRSAPRGPC